MTVGRPVRPSHALVVGIGFRKGVPAAHLRAAISAALTAAGLEAAAVATIATLERKCSDPELRSVAGEFGADLTGVSDVLLSGQRVPHSSVAVQRAVGVPSVAEAAVLAAGGEIVQPKLVFGSVTVAVGERR